MRSLDLAVLRALYAGDGSPRWVAAIAVVSFLGSGWMLAGMVPALATRRLRIRATAALATLAVTSAVVALVKALTGRVRPCNAIAWAHVLRIEAPSDHSFPSGHAAGSFAFAVFVWNLNRPLGSALIALACLVGWSRVALGVHFPSDVVAGALLGSALGWAGAHVYRSASGATDDPSRSSDCPEARAVRR